MLRRYHHSSFHALESVLGLLCPSGKRSFCAPAGPNFQYTPPPYCGPSRDEVMKLRKEFLSPGIFHHFKSPVMIVNGKMQYLFDETGRRYLDAFAGIVTVSVGHCHSKVNEAVQSQMSKLQHTTTIYLNDQIAQYGKELAEKMPGSLKVCYFVNSGSEANDLALLMARVYSSNKDIVCLRNCYHGVSLGTMPACGHSTWRHDVGTSGMLHAMNPDPYRGAFGADSEAYAKDLQDLVRAGSSGRLAGFLAETIQGVGGAVPLADGYLPKAYEIVRAAGGLCIADEVQTGFGRTGSHFWGFQRQNVTPDIVTMAKGIGNGLPLAAVVTTPEIAAVLTQKLHLNTFGGNPAIEEDGLQANSAAVGGYLKDQIKALSEKHSIIGDVRGAGLMLGVEFVTDRDTKERKSNIRQYFRHGVDATRARGAYAREGGREAGDVQEPASKEVAHVMETLKDKHSILIGKGGLDGNVFRIKPPMCFTQQDAEYLTACMDESLSNL